MSDHPFRWNWLAGAVVLPLVAVQAESTSGNQYIQLSLTQLLAQEVYTPAKQNQRLRDTPATTLVVTADQIRARGYRNLVDLLEMLPGFDVQRRSEASRYNDITMRGNFKHRRFIILQDGVQVDAPTDDILAIADNYPLYYAKQVEVVYGPNSALWGTDAFGGVINIITKTGAELSAGEVSVRRGGDDLYYDHFVVGSRPGEDWSLILGGHRHATDNPDLASSWPEYFGPKDAVTSNDDVVRSAAEREAFRTPERSRSLFARADYDDWLTLGAKHDRMSHSSSNGVDPSHGLYDDTAKVVTENTTLYADLRYDLGEALAANTKMNYGFREMQPETTYIQSYTDLVPVYKYAKEERREIEQQLTYQWNDTQTLTLGGVYQDFYAIVRPPDTQDVYQPDLSPQEQQLRYLNVDLPIEVEALDYRNTAAYIQLQSRWSDQFSSTLGMRYDRHSLFGDSWNPRIGLVYHASDTRTWKLLYGEAFRAPSPAEAKIVYGAFSTEVNEHGDYVSSWMQVPNLDLEPEKLRSLELSFSQYWGEGSLTASAYYSTLDRVMATMTTDEPAQFVDGGHIETTAMVMNLDEAKYYGFDLAAEVHLDLASGWSADVWGAYSYVDGEDRSPSSHGVEPSYIANHKIRLGTTFSLNNRYFLTPKLRINSPTNTNNLLDKEYSSKRSEAPGYAVVDVHFAAKNVFNIKGLTGSFDIYNLFDRRYFSAGGQGAPVFFDRKPQDPRLWVASLAYRFDL